MSGGAWAGGKFPPVDYRARRAAGAGIFNGVTKYVAQYHDNRNSCAAWSALHQRWYLVSLRDGAGFCAGSCANQPGIVW